MTRRASVTHEFVEFVPRDLQDGRVYVSIEYATAVHRCACGCGNKVVTPITPTDWKLSFDGETISLYPSIGNWSFPCRSHYWIRENRVEWASRWSRHEVEAGRDRERDRKYAFYEEPRRSEERREMREEAWEQAREQASSEKFRDRLWSIARRAWRALGR